MAPRYRQTRHALPLSLALGIICCQAIAQQQVPKPIRNQSFAQPLQDTGLRRVQAYERVGKQIFPSQPTGRTVLNRTHSSPWIERFMKPRKSSSSAATQGNFPSVAGTQPPLQNAANGRTQTPTRNRTAAQQPIPSAPSRPAFLNEPNRRGYDVGSRYTSVPQGSKPTATQNTGVGIGALPGFAEQKTASIPSPKQAESSRATTPPKATSSRIAKSEPAAPSPSLSTSARNVVEPTYEAPKVSRIPLPNKPKSTVKTTRAPQSVTSGRVTTTQQPSTPTSSAPSVPRTSPSNLNRPAKVAETKPEPVSVPTRLVNAPRSQSAARQESNTRPPELYLATQIKQKMSSGTSTKTTSKAPVSTKASSKQEFELELPKIPELPASKAVEPSSLGLEGSTRKPNQTPKVTVPEVKAPKQAEVPSLELALPKPTKPTSGVPKVAEKSIPPVQAVAQPNQKQTAAPPVQKKAAQPSAVAVQTQPAVSEKSAAQQTAMAAARPVTAPKTRKMPPVSKVEPKVKPPVQTQVAQPAVQQYQSNSFARFGTVGGKSLYSRSPNERMQTQAPHLRVVLNGPQNVPVGVPANYEVVVYNEDQIDLEGLILRVEVPAGVAIQPGRPDQGQFDLETAPDGAALLTWGIEKLPGGRVAKAPIRMAARAAKDFNVGLDWTLVPLSRSASIHVISPRVDVAIVGPEDVLFGDSNTYKLRVRNMGDAVAENVSVKVVAEEFGSSTSEVGNIQPGAVETMEIELEFEQKGKIHVDVFANGTNNVKSQTAMDIMVRKPNLISRLSAPQMVYHGSAVNYTATVKNTGDAPASQVVGFLKLPAGAQPVSLPYGAVQEGRSLKWPISKLEPEGVQEFTFQINLPGEGENQVELECIGKAAGSTKSNALTVVQAIPDLKLIVSDPIAPAPVGSEVVYELNLTNRGSKAAHNVRVIAQFSKGIEPTRSGGHGYRVVPGQVFFDPIGTVAAGQTVKLQVYAIADNDGMHRFRAEVRTDDENIRLVQEESTQYLNTETRIAAPIQSSPLR